MNDVLLKALSYVAIILIGFVLKKCGYFRQSDYKILNTVVFNVTLPAAVLSNLGKFRFDPSLLLLAPMGLLFNFLASLAGHLLSRKRSLADRALFTINLPGFNVGAFVLPLVQTFLGPAAMVSICLFDVGNAVMCTGGNLAAATLFVGGRQSFHPAEMAKKLLRTLGFSVYFIFVPMAMLNLSLPLPIKTLVDVVAPANGVMAMLMLGIAMGIHFNREYLSRSGWLLLGRYGVAAVLALACYFLLPFPLVTRQALTLCLLAPLSSMATYQTELLGGDPGMASFANTLSIPISLCIIVPLITVMVS